MTYSESNRSFIKSILKPYFREAGITVQEDSIDRIVDGIIMDEDFKNINADTGHDLILQKGLTLLKHMGSKNSYNS